MSYEQQASIIDVTGHAGLAMRSLARSADAEIAKYRPYYDAVRKAHNGYEAKGKGGNPVKEPATPDQALKELNDEWEEMLDQEIEKRIAADAKIAEQAAEIERLEKVMAACASLAGQDWLTGLLALAEALDATYGTENLDYVLGRYAALTPPQGDSDE